MRLLAAGHLTRSTPVTILPPIAAVNSRLHSRQSGDSHSLLYLCTASTQPLNICLTPPVPIHICSATPSCHTYYRIYYRTTVPSYHCTVPPYHCTTVPSYHSPEAVSKHFGDSFQNEQHWQLADPRLDVGRGLKHSTAHHSSAPSAQCTH